MKLQTAGHVKRPRIFWHRCVDGSSCITVRKGNLASWVTEWYIGNLRVISCLPSKINQMLVNITIHGSCGTLICHMALRDPFDPVKSVYLSAKLIQLMIKKTMEQLIMSWKWFQLMTTCSTWSCLSYLRIPLDGYSPCWQNPPLGWSYLGQKYLLQTCEMCNYTYTHVV